MNSTLKLYQLECLVAVADRGSVRKAATYLTRSPTAVSNALRELEKTVNAVLLERRVEGVILTEAGAALLAHARLVLRQLQRASDEVSHMAHRPGGLIRMAIAPWLMHGVLPDVVRDFRVQRPDVQIDISEQLGGEYLALRNGQLDFAFGPQPDNSNDSALDVRPMYTYSYAVVSRRDHPAANAHDIADLLNFDWLLSRAIGRMIPELLGQRNESASPDICRVHYVRSVHAALAIVRSTDMLSVVPWPLIESPDIRDRYTALNLGGLRTEGTTCLITRRYEPLQGAALAFLNTFRRVAHDLENSPISSVRRIFAMVESHLVD
ncbi:MULTISPECIES: LysR substrate-binding domain-containing protein [Paraburkholderia]|nr:MULTISPECIES: LysR substrate-binding domain-containing protein [Paraburkholderia]